MRGVRIMDAQRSLTVSRPQFSAPGTVMVRPLLLKPQWMNGLSERLLVSHYENNYGGALRRLNAIRARLAALDWERAPLKEISAASRPGARSSPPWPRRRAVDAAGLYLPGRIVSGAWSISGPPITRMGYRAGRQSSRSICTNTPTTSI